MKSLILELWCSDTFFLDCKCHIVSPTESVRFFSPCRVVLFHPCSATKGAYVKGWGVNSGDKPTRVSTTASSEGQPDGWNICDGLPVSLGGRQSKKPAQRKNAGSHTHTKNNGSSLHTVSKKEHGFLNESLGHELGRLVTEGKLNPIS